MDSAVLTAKALCTISVRSKGAAGQLDKLARELFADGIDPIEYKCLRCGTEWDCSPCDEWRDRTCSNCYSERVVITKVRLEFSNWGEQNGGEREQRERFERAKQAYDFVASKLARAKEPTNG